MYGPFKRLWKYHALHHYKYPETKAFGVSTTLWDWVFGTLCMPEKGQRIHYGLGHKDTPLETVTGSVLAPFGRAARIIWQRFALRRPSAPPAE